MMDTITAHEKIGDSNGIVKTNRDYVQKRQTKHKKQTGSYLTTTDFITPLL